MPTAKRFLYAVLALLLVMMACSPEEPTPTPEPELVEITVYFTDMNAYIAGTPPYEVPVTRMIPPPASYPEAVLAAFFQGPTPEEQSLGLELILSGATGFSALDIQDGIARVYLTGQCNSQGATYTIANPLLANLLQFDEVTFVKIYDENGFTQQPDGDSHSIPGCLEP